MAMAYSVTNQCTYSFANQDGSSGNGHLDSNQCPNVLIANQTTTTRRTTSVATSSHTTPSTATPNVTNEINHDTNKLLLMQLNNGWRYVTDTVKEYKNMFNNVKDIDIKSGLNKLNLDEIKLENLKNKCVRLISAPECVGRIQQAKEMGDGSIKIKVFMKCKCVRNYFGSQLELIPRVEFKRASRKVKIPKDLRRYLFINLEVDNNLGKKLANYVSNIGTSNNSCDSIDEMENELIERLDASIDRYYHGMLWHHSLHASNTKNRLNKYLKEQIQVDKGGRTRIRAKTRNNHDHDDKKQGTQELKSNSNNKYLTQFINNIVTLIHTANNTVTKTSNN